MRSRFVPVLLAGWTVLGGGLALAESPEAAAGPAPILRVLAERPLPASMVWAFDIRWADDRTVWIAAGKQGVVAVGVPGEPERPPGPVVAPEAPGAPWLATRLALSASHVVAGAPVFSYSWSRRSPLGFETVPFDAVVDLDLSAGRLLVLGGLRDERQRFSPDGAIGWIGPVEGEREELRPVLYSRHGAGARTMGECGMLGLGAVRFLGDGSFLIVPGVEPGILWYSPSGQLRRAWENREVGLEDECAPVLGRTGEIARDPVALNRWLGRRAVVDEILDLPQGPGLVIRRDDGGTIRWTLVRLGSGGEVDRTELPFSASSGWAHLKGDVRGRRVAFLVVEHGPDAEKPAAPPRLIFAELPP